MGKGHEIGKVQELSYELMIGDVMTCDVITVAPNDRVADLREVFHKNRISGTPVMEDGRLVGIISVEDFIKCLASGEMNCFVMNKMTRKIEVLYADEPVVHAIDKFHKCGFGRFPVLDRDTARLVGILSIGDIVRGLLKRLEIDYHEEEIRRYRASHIFEDIIADKTSLHLRYYIVGGDFDHAGRPASTLKKTLGRLGFHPRVARRVAIASYEAEINIVAFARTGEIRARVHAQYIQVQAVDRGPGIADIEQAMQPGFSTAPQAVRDLGFGAGMGLHNIKKTSDEMILESKVGEGTDLRMTFYLYR